MAVLDEVDAEILKALRVIRGDHDKKTGKSSQIAQAIVSAIQIQGQNSTNQNAEILAAIKEQTAIQTAMLEKLTEMLSKRQIQPAFVPLQPISVPQQEDEDDDDDDNSFHRTEESLRACEDTKAAKTKTTKSRSVPPEHAVEEENCFHSTEESMRAHEAEVKKTKAEKDRIAAEQMVADYDNDAGVFAALDKADSDEEEQAAAAVVARSAPAPIPRQPRGASAVLQDPLMKTKKKNGKTVITGPWAFVETSVALRRRGRVENSDLLNMEDSLFGKANSTADVLSGDSFGRTWDRMRNPVDQYGKLKPPKWSSLDKKKSIRTLLPKLAIGGETQIKLNTGVYYLTVKYSNDQIAEDNEAAIIIGEIAFDNRGFVLAAGADWNKLFGGQKQLEAPSASGNKAGGKLKWHSSKVSEAWKDGDTLKFKIDTTTNTLGYTIQGENDAEVRTGWMFANVLAFTNNKMYPNFLNVFAYVGGSSMHAVAQGKGANFSGVRFSLKETKRSNSVLNLQALAEEE
mmetsp:Transcript_18558/g.20767  ORF Transcript_18558/g.20767 Transcript_18558/m.20767 type:complete len:514 (-) Transcript_18558:186-1727(-)